MTMMAMVSRLRIPPSHLHCYTTRSVRPSSVPRDLRCCSFLKLLVFDPVFGMTRWIRMEADIGYSSFTRCSSAFDRCLNLVLTGK